MNLLRIPLLLACFGVAGAADPPTVTVVDLSQDGTMHAANAINDAGEVVGHGDVGAGPHALLLRDGVLLDLGTAPGFPTSRALSINADGQIVGYGTRGGDYLTHALLWSTEGDLLDIHPSSASYSWAAALNDRGDVVVNFGDAGGNPFAGLRKNEDLISLGPGFGQAISRQGWVAGTSVWQHGRESALFGDVATAINDHGQVVGYRITGNASGEGFLRRFPPDVRTPLPPLPLDTVAIAHGVDRYGRVVGASIFCEFECNSPQTRAVYWQDGVAVALPPLPPYGSCLARGINDRGEIVGACALWCTPNECGTGSRAVLWRME